MAVVNAVCFPTQHMPSTCKDKLDDRRVPLMNISRQEIIQAKSLAETAKTVTGMALSSNSSTNQNMYLSCHFEVYAYFAIMGGENNIIAAVEILI